MANTGKLVTKKIQYGYDSDSAYTIENTEVDGKSVLQVKQNDQMGMLEAKTPTREDSASVVTVEYVNTPENNDVYLAFKDFVLDEGLEESVDAIDTKASTDPA